MATKQHDPESYNRIFILGAKNCTEDSLREMFEKFGVVKDVYFVKDRRTEERKGTCESMMMMITPVILKDADDDN